LTGLTTGDPHTQYALLAGRSGGQSLSGGTAANDDLTLQGTTNATRTTSYVIMQPNGGNVGIGTASPGYKIDVDGGNVTQAARFYNSSAAFTIIEVGGTANNSSSNLLLSSNSGTAEIWKSGTGGTTYGGVSSLNLYSSNGAIAFHPNNQQNAMFLDTSGRVGIGTAGPQAPLHVIAASTSSDALIQEWSYAADSQDEYSLMLKQTITFGVVRYNFSMVNNNTAYNDVLVLDRGNVGIGTTSPGRKLHVAGTIIVDGDEGGIAGTVGFTDVSDLATRSTGVGTIKFDDGTNRDSSGFIKVYIGTTAYYVPVFSAI
jgi:hypothetical protein